MRFSKNVLPVFVMALLTFAPALRAQEKGGNGSAEDYDFTRPGEVFEATLVESVKGRGIDPALLAEVLRTGQVVIVNDRPNNPDIPWLTTGGVLVNAPAERVFQVIEDTDHYHEFVPQTERAWSESLTDEVEIDHYDLAIQILFIKVKVPYSVYRYKQPPHRVDWVAAEGEFDVNMGAYEVVPVPGLDDRSMLFYTSYALPRNAVVKSLFKRIPMLDMMLNLSTGTLVVRAMKERSEMLCQEAGKTVRPPEKLELVKLMHRHPETLGKLAARGKLVVLENTDPLYFSGGVVVEKPRDEVFRDITDFEGMSGIQEQVEMEVLEKDERGARVRVNALLSLMIDFESEYVLDYEFHPPDRINWTAEPGGDIEGVEGSWELVELSPQKTLIFYRGTSDLESMGFMMRQLLKIEPAFALAIQASQAMYMVSDAKRWCEASPARRRAMAETAKKKQGQRL